MQEDFLNYYHQELAFIRQQGKAFAKAYPKVAGRLKLGSDMSEDPHLARLIESFAFLTARVQQRIEDDLPELNNILLDIIYPHYRLPIPSMSVAQFTCQSDLQKPYEIPKHTLLETELIQDNPCHFRTGYSVTALPVEIIETHLYNQSLVGPQAPHIKSASACIKLTLRCTLPELTFDQLASSERLRFYLNLEPPYVYELYELLFNHLHAITLMSSHANNVAITLPKNNLQAVGFAEDEALLPYSARSFAGYRILSEFFTYPMKFLFIDLIIEQQHWRQLTENHLEIYLYLNKLAENSLERQIDEQVFCLNCTPIVNLFPYSLEPIRMDYTQPEYPIVTDARKPNLYQLHSIEQVTGINDNGKLIFYRPFYSAKYQEDVQAPHYWQLFQCSKIMDSGAQEFSIAFTNAELEPLTSTGGELTVHIDALVTNGKLPTLLPFGGNSPNLQLVNGSAAIKKIICLRACSQPLQPSLRKGKRWQLVSHLALNHLSLTNNEQGLAALKEILQLYNYKNTDAIGAMIEGIISIQSKRIAVRSRMGLHDTLYHGTELMIEVDETCYVGSSIFLFACILERFLQMYCTINTFIELVIRSKQKQGELYRWTPRAGSKVLL